MANLKTQQLGQIGQIRSGVEWIKMDQHGLIDGRVKSIVQLITLSQQTGDK